MTVRTTRTPRTMSMPACRAPATTAHRGRPRPSRCRAAAAAANGETDFDLVEASFIDAADGHPDPTSLLRLAGVPFTTTLDDGRTAHLLGYAIENAVEVGAVAPGFDGRPAAYHPVPASRIRNRRQLRFHYWTPRGEVALTLAAARRNAT